jgi:SWI/SNF related-matrix-associated actin-dependent regulator of chromatin subfamily C
LAASCLGAVAVKAQMIEEREYESLQRAITQLVHVQLKKLILKLSLIDKLESVMEGELVKLAAQKQQLVGERFLLNREKESAMQSNSVPDWK